MREWPYTASNRDELGCTSPPTSRFPSALEMSLGLRPRDISRASGNLLVVGDVQPNTSLLSAVYGYNTPWIHSSSLCCCTVSQVQYVITVSKQRLCWVGWVVQHLNNGVALERALHCLLDETGNYKHIHNFHVIIYNSNPLNNAVQHCIAMQELCHAMHHNDPPVWLPPYFYC